MTKNTAMAAAWEHELYYDSLCAQATRLLEEHGGEPRWWTRPSGPSLRRVRTDYTRRY